MMDENFVNDVMGHNNHRVNHVILIPFSNKAFNYLNGITDLREFANALNHGTITDEQFTEICLDISDNLEEDCYWDDYTE